MTSFVQTMFVPHSPPNAQFPQSPKPLPALHSNILAESVSCIHLQWPSSPQSVYQSPLQRHIQHVFDYGSSPPTQPQMPMSAHYETRQREVHRNNFMGHGFGDLSKKTDLLSRSNSNARKTAFQPQKRAKGTNSWQLKQFAEATLGSGSLKKVVMLPEGEDRDEWLAVNGMRPKRSRPCTNC